MIDDGFDVAHGGFGFDDRRVILGRLIHLRRPRRPAIAAQVEQIYVIALARDVIHPGKSIQFQIKRGFGRIGRTVNVEQSPFRREGLHVGGTLVANVEFDACIFPRHGVILDREFHVARLAMGVHRISLQHDQAKQ